MKPIESLRLALALSLLSSCSSRDIEFELPATTAIESVLALEPCAPFDCHTLLAGSAAEDAYGQPRDSGVDVNGRERTFWKEYAGKLGRVRVYVSVSSDGDEDSRPSRWFEVYPGALYVTDLLREPYTIRDAPSDGAWTLNVHPARQPPAWEPWYLSVHAEGRAVRSIEYFPPSSTREEGIQEAIESLNRLRDRAVHNGNVEGARAWQGHIDALQRIEAGVGR